MGLSAIRSRAMSPIRATYSDARRNIERSYAGGGTTAGANVLRARLAREGGQSFSDAATNTEGMIAQIVANNKLQGLGGLTNLYGTTPGNTALQSQNVLQNTNQGLSLLQGENQRMQGTLDTSLGLTKAPGRTDSALGQVGQVVDIGKKIFSPIGR